MKIQNNILLKDYTTYKIGGPAKYFVRIGNLEELREAFKIVKKENLHYFILGGGSNSLISDKGFNGLVILIENNEIKKYDNKLQISSGLSLQDAINFATEYNLKGLEWGEGIPGMVGGAIRSNAGAFGEEIKNVLESIKTYDPESNMVKEYHNSEADFSYRNSIFKNKAYKEVILSAVFKLSYGKEKDIARKRNQYKLYRLENHPQEPSCGSVFKNIKDKKFLQHYLEKHSEIREQYIKNWIYKIPAAYFIAEAGLTGFQMGQAQVSPKHTNFIINKGKAEADEIARLISFIKSRVKERFGVRLQEEMQYIGWQ